MLKQQESNHSLNKLLIYWGKVGIISLAHFGCCTLLSLGKTWLRHLCSSDFIATGCKMVISDMKLCGYLTKMMLPSFFRSTHVSIVQ